MEWLVCIALAQELQMGDGGEQAKVGVRKASRAAIRARREREGGQTDFLEGAQKERRCLCRVGSLPGLSDNFLIAIISTVTTVRSHAPKQSSSIRLLWPRPHV